MKFSDRMDRFEDEVFASLNNKRLQLEKEGKRFFNLSIGTPDFEVEERFKQALIDAVADPDNWHYALRDLPEMLQAVCDYYKKRFGVTITPDMVCSCYGTQEGLGHLGLALVNEGDTCLLPTPCYPLFISSAMMAGAKPWYYPMTAENGFLPKVSEIPEDIAKDAKYMVLSLPSNPMGSVGNREVYDEVIAFAKKYDIIVIHDNAYSDIIFDGNEGTSFLSYEGASDVGVEFFSLSKSFNLTGARISFCVGRPDIIDAFKKLRSQIDFGMFIPMQKVAIEALTGPLDHVQKQNKMYEERRDALCQGLRTIGWELNDSHGSMFVWAPIPASYTSSMEFCMDLMEKAGVIVTPGSSFGPLGEGYVRFALVLPPEKLREVIKAIDESGICK